MCLEPNLGSDLESVLGVGLGKVVVGPALQASVFIARDPLQCSDEMMLWACVLRGGWLLSADFLSSRRGVCIKLLAGIALRTRVWVSDAFQQQRPLLFRLLQDACTWPGSCLSLLPNMKSFVILKVVRSNWSSPRVSAEIADDELGDETVAGVPHCFGATDFLASPYRLDVHRGTL